MWSVSANTAGAIVVGGTTAGLTATTGTVESGAVVVTNSGLTRGHRRDHR